MAVAVVGRIIRRADALPSLLTPSHHRKAVFRQTVSSAKCAGGNQ